MYNSHLFRLSALLVTIIIAFVSCSEDDCPSCPENTDGNLFTVRVLDTSGNPLRDIRVGSINHHYQTAATRKSSGSALATALINFSIAEHGYVKLDIFNYYAQWVETVIDSVHMNAGSYAAEWLGTDHNDNVVVSGYYFAQLWTESAADTTVLVLELGSEPSQTIIGSTDNDGYFVTNDTLYFPGLLG
ncbi:MAG: hypothetical protein GY841_04970, partial [FCB group bacterium]|nr:hypothetical protein [FCB group bacterium]